MNLTLPIITVSGAHSGVGKTMLIENLLKKLRGWSCLKVTVLHHDLLCPAHRNCGACDNLSSNFSIINDKKIIEEQGKDTWRFKKAGAKNVLWLKVKSESLSEGLKRAIPMFKCAKGLIIEGTSVLKYLHPDLAIFIKRDNSPLKDSAKEILKKIDLILTL